jgi:hypothetical protein
VEATSLTVKKSVTIPESIAAEATTLAGERGFSAYTTAALRNQIAQDKLGLMVEEFNNKYGVIDNTIRETLRADILAAQQRRIA